MKSCLVIPFLVASVVAAPNPRMPAVAPAYLNLAASEPLGELVVVNNHPFGVREWMAVPVAAVAEEENWAVEVMALDGGRGTVLPLQLSREGERVVGWVETQLEAGKGARYTLRPVATPKASDLEVEVAARHDSGLPSAFKLGGLDLPVFDLSLAETTDNLATFHLDRESSLRRVLEESKEGGGVRFEQTARRAGPTLVEFRHEGTGGRLNEYGLVVVHRIWRDGTVEIDVRLETLDLRSRRSYLAVAKHLTAEAESAVVDWKGERHVVAAGSAAADRSARTHHWGRDVNWFAIGASPEGVLLDVVVAGYTPGLTRMHRDTLRNVNDFLVNETVVGTKEGWVMLGEIARDQRMLRTYIPQQFIPPDEGESLTMRYRLPPPGGRSGDDIDRLLIAWEGYRGAYADGRGRARVNIGVPGVSFGTNYFPNSTFGENFEYWRAADMTGGRDGRDVSRWWPIFRHWKFFKEDIRRDLRIMNSLGIEWFRIHDNPSPSIEEDYLRTPEGAWMMEYLDFMAEAAREVGLGILYDFSISPGDVALVAKKHGDVIQYYEIQNEVLLIPGAKAEYFDYWKEVRRRIHEERPGLPVFVTGAAHLYALFDGLAERGIKFDAVGQHGYVDRRETPSYFRDMAISLGGYATRHGMLPINTEYNWRMITRETEEEQADHFDELSEHLLRPRSIPVAFQFQYQETFTVPPRSRGALRHYEPLRLDRTPKPQAWVFRDSIRRYGEANNRLRHLELVIEELEINPGEAFRYEVSVTNVSGRDLTVTLESELPAGFTSEGGVVGLALKPGERKVVPRVARAPDDLEPGVHHFFEAARYDDDLLYAWGIARHARHPRLDLMRPILDNVTYSGGIDLLDRIDLSTFTGSVFGETAPALEVDWALYLYHSLRAATGSTLSREKDSLLSPEQGAERNLVVVGTPQSNGLLRAVEDRLPSSFADLGPGEGMIALVRAPLGRDASTWLVVTGGDEFGVERAASDLLYRYWRHARAAVTFREGMPPMEGSWAGTEPERPPPAPRAVPRAEVSQSITLQMPREVTVGQDFRVVAIDSAEPPGPAQGVRVSVLVERNRLLTAITSPTGEVTFRLEAPGVYEVRVDGVPTSAARLVVKQ